MPVLEAIAEPRVTTRWVIDHSRKCAARCAQCYWLPTDDFYTVDSWETVQQEVAKASARGCDCIEVTGGEPLIADWIVDLVKLCVEKNMPPRIITSLVCPEKTLDAVLDAGVGDWLISLHGAKAETHDAIVAVPKARSLQIRRMAKIADRMDYCTNYTMLEANQTEMADFARWILNCGHRPPKVANFINFNVFGDWLRSPEWVEKGKANVVDLRIAGPILDEAIDILEEAGVGVNVRYYPMCGLAERHRKNVCNDLVVALDFGEWLNAIPANTLASAERYGRELSKRNELKTAPCSNCGLQWICGGANRIWHQLALEKFGVETLVPQPAPVDLTEPAYWHFRKHNTLGLDPRR